MLAVHTVKTSRQQQALIGHRFEQSVGGRQLVIDDIAQGPLPAHPRPRIGVARRDVARRRKWLARIAIAQLLGCRLGLWCASRAIEAGERLFHRGRYPGTRYLRQQPEHVVPPGLHHEPTLPPGRVHRVVDHAGVIFLLQGRAHGVAQHAVQLPDHGIDIGVDGILKRRHEDPGAVAAHLVLVQIDRWEPLLVHQAVDHPAFHLCVHEGVAIVIVAGVLVIQLRQEAVLPLRAEVLVVPIGDDDLAVRVERGDQQEDDVVENVLDEGRILGGEAMHQLEGHLAGADLDGVNVAGNEQNRLVPGQ